MKEKKQAKQHGSALKTLIVLLLVIILLATSLGLFAWAKYVTSLKGTSAVDVAKWNFDLTLRAGERTVTSPTQTLDLATTTYQNIAEGKIAPGVQGTYIYTVENYGEKPMVYDMKYTDENPYKINMVYKLKRNGQYVAGNENTWVNLSKLDLKDLKIKSKTTDIYSLEWKWEDSENDTEIGETEGANYKLFISSYAEEDVQ